MPHRYDSTRSAKARRSLRDEETSDLFDIPLDEKALFLKDLNEKYNLKKNRSLVGGLFVAMSALAFGGAIAFAIKVVIDDVEELEKEAESLDVLEEDKSWWQRFFEGEKEPKSPTFSRGSVGVPDQELPGASDSEGAPTTKTPSDTKGSRPSSPKEMKPKEFSGVAQTAKKWHAAGSYGKAAKGLPAAVAYASKQTGVEPSVLYAFAFKETRFGKIMNNKTSSAQGVFQFLPTTWKEIERRHGKKYPILLMGPKNLKAAALGAALMISQLARSYRKHFASPPSVTDLYMMYLLGPTGGLRFLKALDENPETRASSIFPKEAKSNPSVFNSKSGPRSLGGVYRYMESEIGEVEQVLRSTNVPPISPVSDSEGLKVTKQASIEPIKELVPPISTYQEDVSPVNRVAFDSVVSEAMHESEIERGVVGNSQPQEFFRHDGFIVAVS